VSEVEPDLVQTLQTRFATDPRVTVRQLDLLGAEEAEYTGFVALNVLEHIEDDRAAVRAAAGLVRDGGAVIFFVPAFSFAMGEFDRAVGHYRRYTVSSMRRVLVDAGVVPERVHYVNAPGLPAWFVGMRLLRMTPSEGPILRAWDRMVVPLARRIERRFTPPFGQSVFAVARAHVSGRAASAVA
jgi:hypothetical protein